MIFIIFYFFFQGGGVRPLTQSRPSMCCIALGAGTYPLPKYHDKRIKKQYIAKHQLLSITCTKIWGGQEVGRFVYTPSRAQIM